MKKLFLFFSHKNNFSKIQKEDAKVTLGVEAFVTLPSELQELWSNVPPEIEELATYLEPFKHYLQKQSIKDDVVLIHGEAGSTYTMVNIVKELGLEAVHATSKRNVVEKKIGNNKIEKVSVFEHSRFRVYA